MATSSTRYISLKRFASMAPWTCPPSSLALERCFENSWITLSKSSIWFPWLLVEAIAKCSVKVSVAASMMATTSSVITWGYIWLFHTIIDSSMDCVYLELHEVQPHFLPLAYRNNSTQVWRQSTVQAWYLSEHILSDESYNENLQAPISGKKNPTWDMLETCLVVSSLGRTPRLVRSRNSIVPSLYVIARTVLKYASCTESRREFIETSPKRLRDTSGWQDLSVETKQRRMVDALEDPVLEMEHWASLKLVAQNLNVALGLHYAIPISPIL